MNQGGALINIYLDGSVLLTHGGVEMGQGINTKMVAIAVAELSRLGFGPNLESVFVDSTNTSRVPNTNPTAAVTGTELNGRAVKNACEMLISRLTPIYERMVEQNKEVTWLQLVKEAYHEHISLSAAGHGSLSKLFHTYDWNTGVGESQFYFIWAAGCAEIELDVLTGSYRVLRVDIVHDLGQPLNPAIDKGQVLGGFAQGLGLFTIEDQIWDQRDGHLRTRNVSTYKIPSHDDMPGTFNIHFLSHDTCATDEPERPLYSAKTAGESGLQLAYSVVLALKQAIYSISQPTDSTTNLTSIHPLTVDRLRALCPPVPRLTSSSASSSPPS